MASPADTKAPGPRALLRRLDGVLPRIRIATGIVLLAYISTHLLNHTLGVWSLEAMEAGRPVFLAVWRSVPGTVLLYGAMILHLIVVLISLYRRRSLRMSVGEALQVVAGLALPPLLMAHGLAMRGLHEEFGIDDRYAFLLLGTYVTSPSETAKLIAGTVLAWVTACSGSISGFV